MNLTPHFTLSELCASETADKRGIDNRPGPKEQVALKALCEALLEPLRVLLGKPLRINSGFRCASLNRAVGGVVNSQHVRGEAADIECPGLSNADLAKMIVESGLPFDQLIEECFSDDPSAGWVHVSFVTSPARNRGEVLSGR